MQSNFALRGFSHVLGMSLFLATVSASAAHAQNLLVNGSFENGNFTGVNPQNAADATDLAQGATNMDGWTVVSGTGVADVAWIINGNPYGIVASDLTHSLDLTGYQDHAPYGGVMQTLTLTKGNTYTLSFDLASIEGNGQTLGPVGVTAIVGNLNQTFTFSAAAGTSGPQFGTETATFVATNATTTLTLVGASTSGGQYIGLDNVKITGNAAAPEPSSLALASATGLLLLGGLRRRRKSRVV